MRKEISLETIYAKLDSDEQAYLETKIDYDTTGARNRSAFDKYENVQNSRFERGEGPLCLIMLDIDNFKVYNDKKGHQRGDTALKNLVRVVDSVLRLYDEDQFYRYGGEEFVIGFGGKTVKEGREIADRIRLAINESTECDFTVSIGVSDSLVAGNNMKNIVRTADKAMYEAKRSGRNSVVVYRDSPKMPSIKPGIRY